MEAHGKKMFKSQPEAFTSSHQSSTALQILDVLEASSSEYLFTSVAISSHHHHEEPFCEKNRIVNSTTTTAHTKWKSSSLPNIKQHTTTLKALKKPPAQSYPSCTMLMAGGESSGLVSIWQLSEEKGQLLNREPILLLAHSDDEVMSVCFGTRKKELFCSASNKVIKLWNIYACLQGVQQDGGKVF